MQIKDKNWLDINSNQYKTMKLAWKAIKTISYDKGVIILKK